MPALNKKFVTSVRAAVVTYLTCFWALRTECPFFWLFWVELDLFSMKRVPFSRHFSVLVGPFWPFWAILAPFGPFLALFGAQNGLGSPKMQGWTGQNGPKGGQQAIKTCFGTVLDHLEAIGPHLGAKKKSKKKYFSTFFNIFWHVRNLLSSGWAPCSAVQCTASRQQRQKIDKNRKKIAQKK